MRTGVCLHVQGFELLDARLLDKCLVVVGEIVDGWIGGNGFKLLDWSNYSRYKIWLNSTLLLGKSND